jgi:dCMP deaminase
MKFYEKLGVTKNEEHIVPLRLSYFYADKNSDDKDTKVGVTIKSPLGLESFTNTLVKGTPDTEENITRPKKYDFIEHAERNAIYAFAKKEQSISGSTIYSPWFPCIECARAIVGSGITKMVNHLQAIEKTPEHWIEKLTTAYGILSKANIEMEAYDGKIGFVKNRMNKEIWYP